MKLTVIIIFHDVCQTTMLYTINLYNALCQLHPNKNINMHLGYHSSFSKFLCGVLYSIKENKIF